MTVVKNRGLLLLPPKEVDGFGVAVEVVLMIVALALVVTGQMH